MLKQGSRINLDVVQSVVQLKKHGSETKAAMVMPLKVDAPVLANERGTITTSHILNLPSLNTCGKESQ